MKILDATCGHRGIWFNKKHKDTTYIDIRLNVKPDIVMDCRKTTFSNKYFDLIVFDPPHGNIGIKMDMAKRYGHYTISEIRSLIKDSFKEFHRILKDKGFVLFKWSSHDYPLEKILKLIEDFEPLFGQKISIRTKHSSQTYYVCLKKRF